MSYLRNVRLRLGDEVPTTEAPEFDRTTCEQLAADGVTSILTDGPDPHAAWGLAADGADAAEWLLVCTDAPVSPFAVVAADASAARLARTGTRSRVQVSGNGCADFGLAAALADSLVHEGRAASVGIVGYDVVDGPRLMASDSTVRSDGVTYCELGADPSDAIAELIGVGQAIVPHDRSPADRLRSARSRPSIATDRCLESIGATREDVAVLVCNGYGRVVREFIANVVGVPADRLSPQPRWGHVANADLLIGLDLLITARAVAERPRPSGLVLGVLTGPQVSVALALTLLDG